MSRSKWTRRGFVGSAIAASGYAVLHNLPTDLLPGAVDPDIEELYRDLFRETIGELKVSAELGEVYLSSAAATGKETGLEVIAQLMGQEVDLPSDLKGWPFPRLDIDEGELTELLAAAIKRDFREGNLCHIQGWCLSLTECRLAAAKYYLEYLEQPPLPRSPGSVLSRLSPMFLQKVVEWGPRGLSADDPSSRRSFSLNIQTEGQVDDLTVYIGDSDLSTRISRNRIDASANPREMPQVFGRPGHHSVYLVSLTRQAKQKIGDFQVAEPLILGDLPIQKLARVTSWEPRSIRKGQPLHSLRIDLEGRTDQYVAYLDELKLATRPTFGGLRAFLSSPESQAVLDRPGPHQLFIVNTTRRAKQKIGEFTVLPERPVSPRNI